MNLDIELYNGYTQWGIKIPWFAKKILTNKPMNYLIFSYCVAHYSTTLVKGTKLGSCNWIYGHCASWAVHSNEGHCASWAVHSNEGHCEPWAVHSNEGHCAPWAVYSNEGQCAPWAVNSNEFHCAAWAVYSNEGHCASWAVYSNDAYGELMRLSSQRISRNAAVYSWKYHLASIKITEVIIML